MQRRLLLLILILTFTGCSRKSAVSETDRLRREFEQTLTGATLVGKFNTGGTKLSEDRYTIQKVSHLQGDVFLFHSRIQYGSHDVTLPLPIKVLWAGDTPVITVTDLLVPGLGTYTARVMIYRNQYAGMWSGKDHGGQMFGRIERPAAR